MDPDDDQQDPDDDQQDPDDDMYAPDDDQQDHDDYQQDPDDDQYDPDDDQQDPDCDLQDPDYNFKDPGDDEQDPDEGVKASGAAIPPYSNSSLEVEGEDVMKLLTHVVIVVALVCIIQGDGWGVGDSFQALN